MNEPYRNKKNRRENEPLEPKGLTRTELYYMERIELWMQYIFWGMVAAIIILFGVLVKVLVN